MNAIETFGLTKQYGRARGIEQVDLQVAKGDFFGFIGPNGAGKSTTIRLLLGLIKPTLGSAQIFGKSIDTNLQEALSHIGYVPSEVNLYPKMTVKQTLQLSAKLHGKNCQQEADALCERLQLDHTRKIHELSLGNRKKVAMICALQHKPELYIMDEPTSGLDPLMQREFHKIMEERNAEGATVFLSSHTLSEIEKHCKHAAIISNGKILACDSIEHFGHTGVKQVCLRGIDAMPQFDGIVNPKWEDGTATFLYKGEPRRLLQELISYSFTDMTVGDTDLEDVFIQYYKEGE